jgi:hypothetical protein
MAVLGKHVAHGGTPPESRQDAEKTGNLRSETMPKAASQLEVPQPHGAYPGSAHA